MKIYFAGSIRGGREDKELYFEIITLLSEFGTVLTEHVGDVMLSEMGDDGPTEEYIYSRDMNWLATSQVVVAEVTTPSLGVGYEIAKAEEMEKPVLCLYRPQEGRSLSAMIAGSSKVTVQEYGDLKAVEVILREFFATL